MSEKTFAKLAAIGGLIAISGAAFAQNATVVVVEPAAAQAEVVATVDPGAPQSSATAGIDLNLRSGPGPQYAILGVIPSMSTLSIQGCIESNSWCQVTHEGMQGWAHADYLLADLGGEPVVIGARRADVNVPVVTYDTSQDENAAVGMTSGIIAGAIVGGPIGAVIGGVGGAILGAASDVPEPVVSYVKSNPMEPLYLDGEVVVGAGLPETVQLQTVPDTEYQYVYVNGVPAVVEPGTRRIVHIVR